MPARKNGFSIVKSNSREDSPLYVKISVRNEKGHPRLSQMSSRIFCI